VGRAISLRFARAGASVIANYVRNQKAADDLLALGQQERLKLQVCRADVSIESGLKRLLESIAEHTPRLSALVHCAATGIHRPLGQLTLRHFDWTYALNVRES